MTLFDGKNLFNSMLVLNKMKGFKFINIMIGRHDLNLKQKNYEMNKLSLTGKRRTILDGHLTLAIESSMIIENKFYKNSFKINYMSFLEIYN